MDTIANESNFHAETATILLNVLLTITSPPWSYIVTNKYGGSSHTVRKLENLRKPASHELLAQTPSMPWWHAIYAPTSW